MKKFKERLALWLAPHLKPTDLADRVEQYTATTGSGSTFTLRGDFYNRDFGKTR